MPSNQNKNIIVQSLGTCGGRTGDDMEPDVNSQNTINKIDGWEGVSTQSGYKWWFKHKTWSKSTVLNTNFLKGTYSSSFNGVECILKVTLTIKIKELWDPLHKMGNLVNLTLLANIFCMQELFLLSTKTRNEVPNFLYIWSLILTTIIYAVKLCSKSFSSGMC